MCKKDSTQTCQTYELKGLSGKQHATRFFATVAVLLSVVGGIISLLRICKDMDGKIVAGFFLGTGVCMVIALSIYTDETAEIVEYNGVSYGWSYIMGWVAAVLSFVTMSVNCLCKE